MRTKTNLASMAHLIVPSQHGLPNTLTRVGDQEWEDTDALFAPEVLGLYPDVPWCPGAASYTVAYGELVALDSHDNQVGVYNPDAQAWD